MRETGDEAGGRERLRKVAAQSRDRRLVSIEDGVADADGVVLGDGVDLVPYVGVLIELDPLDGSVAAVDDQGAALRVGDVGEGEADPAEVAALEGLAFGVV